MTKSQLTAVLTATGLFLVLYLGFSAKPHPQAVGSGMAAEGKKSESGDFAEMLADARKKLTSEQAGEIAKIEAQAQSAANDAEKVSALKRLSGQWFSLGFLPVAGGIAEEVARAENADSSWSVAGATFFRALTQSTDEKIRDFCASHAVKAFESAVSLKPENVQHRVNLALVYAENPPPDKPMTAALMLRELADKYPNDPAPFNALGRLAIKTGQWQRAAERLSHAWDLDKTNPITPCLLAKAYEGLGDAAKANEFAKLCK